MSEPESYRPCKACGTICDGDVCDDRCASQLQEEIDARTITYTLSLTITRSAGDADEAVWMRGSDAQRELEREVLRALKKLDGDCDVEVMTVEAP